MSDTLPKLATASRITYEEFLRWDGENQHVEWVDGEVIEMSPVSKFHVFIVRFLVNLFQHFIEAKDRGGEICFDPFQMKTGPDLPGRAPDLLYVAPEHLHRLHRTWLEGPADLVVEVVSPDDPKRDRVLKFREYEQGGVREYWLIDPQSREALFYLLGEDGRYREQPVVEGIYHSAVLEGLWIRVEWHWQDPKPPLLSVLKEWKLI
jgi:Uma2 family endonuclease